MCPSWWWETPLGERCRGLFWPQRLLRGSRGRTRRGCGCSFSCCSYLCPAMSFLIKLLPATSSPPTYHPYYASH